MGGGKKGKEPVKNPSKGSSKPPAKVDLTSKPKNEQAVSTWDTFDIDKVVDESKQEVTNTSGASIEGETSFGPDDLFSPPSKTRKVTLSSMKHKLAKKLVIITVSSQDRRAPSSPATASECSNDPTSPNPSPEDDAEEEGGSEGVVEIPLTSNRYTLEPYIKPSKDESEGVALQLDEGGVSGADRPEPDSDPLFQSQGHDEELKCTGVEHLTGGEKKLEDNIYRSAQRSRQDILSKKCLEVKKLQNELKQVKDKLTAEETARKKLETKLVDKDTAHLVDLKDQRSEIEKTHNMDLDTKLACLKWKLTQGEAEHQAVVDKLAEKEKQLELHLKKDAENRDVLKRFFTKDSEIEQLKETITQKEAEAMTMKEEITKKETEAVEMKEEITKKETEALAMKEEITKKETEAVEMKEEITKKETEAVAIKEEITKKETEAVAIKEEITKKEIETIAMKETEAEHHSKALKQLNEDHSPKVQRLSQELEAEKKQKADLATTQTYDQQAMEDLDHQLTETLSQLESKEINKKLSARTETAQVAALKTEGEKRSMVAEHQKEIEQLTKQLERSQEDYKLEKNKLEKQHQEKLDEQSAQNRDQQVIDILRRENEQLTDALEKQKQTEAHPKVDMAEELERGHDGIQGDQAGTLNGEGEEQLPLEEEIKHKEDGEERVVDDTIAEQVKEINQLQQKLESDTQKFAKREEDLMNRIKDLEAEKVKQNEESSQRIQKLEQMYKHKKSQLALTENQLEEVQQQSSQPLSKADTTIQSGLEPTSEVDLPQKNWQKLEQEQCSIQPQAALSTLKESHDEETNLFNSEQLQPFQEVTRKLEETEAKLSDQNELLVQIQDELSHVRQKYNELQVEVRAVQELRTTSVQSEDDMSHDELLEYKVSLEHQVEDTEVWAGPDSNRYSRGLEKDIQKLREELRSMCRDRDVWEQSMKDARYAFDEQLSIVRLEADGYKEDFQLVRKQLNKTQTELEAAQEEMQAKTAQVKQYKKRNDQQEDKLLKLEERNEEMERICQKFVETKMVTETNLQKEQKSMKVEMDRVRRELEKERKKVVHLTKMKRMSKGDIQEEYSLLKAEHETLQEDYENLTKTLAQLEEQFSRLKISHLKLKQDKTRPTSLTGGGGSKGAQASPQSTLTATKTDAEKDSVEAEDNRTDAKKLKKESEGLREEVERLILQVRELEVSNSNLKEVIRTASIEAPFSTDSVLEGEDPEIMFTQMRTKFLAQVTKTLELEEAHKTERQQWWAKYERKKQELIVKIEEKDKENKELRSQHSPRAHAVTSRSLSYKELPEDVDPIIQIGSLKQVLQSKEEKIEELNVQVKSFQEIASQHHQLQTNNKAQSLKIVELQRDLKRVQVDTSRLSDEVLAKTQQVRQYEKQTDSYKITRDETADKLENTQTELQKKVKDLKTSKSRADQMLQRLDHELKKTLAQVPKRVRSNLPINLEALAVCPDRPMRFTNPIGKGSYGSVYQVELNGQRCIAKRLHDILIGRPGTELVGDLEKDRIHEKFVRECILLSQMKHDNIVWFMGVVIDHQNKYNLTLLMEQLSTDLDNYLSNKQNKLPLSTKVSILHDISCGLLHLHQQSIIHRDLSAANVLLLIKNGRPVQAKIADLGMSKFVDGNHPLTEAPGALAYMSPESLLGQHYNDSLDIFSFGVICLFAAIQEFPVISYEHVPDEIHRRGEGELFKRRKLIGMMYSKQPELGSLVLWCLQYDAMKRPSTFCLNISLEEMKKDN